MTAKAARIVHVAQGEQAASDRRDTIFATVLGSCVATCLWDPVRGLGGMNHILLTDANRGWSLSHAHGTNAMELMINALLKAGAERARLRAKLFGGARMFAGLSEIGAANADFVERFCRREGIPCLGRSLGGIRGRRIQFWPVTGRVRQQIVKAPRDGIPEAPSAATMALTPTITSDVELF